MSSNPSLEIDSGIQQEKKDHLNEPSIHADDDGTTQNFYCLITGANSGLGLALCCRFLAHFLLTRPPNHHLTLIFTTRSQSKSLQTTQNILGSLHKSFSSSSSTPSKTSRLTSERFTLAPEFVDLTDLQSVYSLSSRLRRSYKKIDWIYCNAGLLTTAGGGGVDYVRGVWAFLTRPIEAATLPDFKLQNKEEVVLQGEKPRGGQIAKVKSVGGKNKNDDKGTVDEKDGLGIIFCANVFGHYCLVRGVLGLLSRGGIRKGERARVIWTSSLDAFSRSLNSQDIQCIRGEEPYESSKRLTDILALTWPEYGFTDLDKSRGPRTTNIDKTRLPKFIVTQPAVCATNIAGQHPLVWYVMLGVFYLVRILCGSPWLPITAWKGNSANMWVAEESEEALDKKGKHKWGSGCGRFGNELVMTTEIEGVNEEGVVSEEFKETGKECWRRMEEFRRVWEGKLGLSCD